MRNVTFSGLTNPNFKFDVNGDPFAQYEIHNLQVRIYIMSQGFDIGSLISLFSTSFCLSVCLSDGRAGCLSVGRGRAVCAFSLLILVM